MISEVTERKKSEARKKSEDRKKSEERKLKKHPEQNLLKFVLLTNKK